MSLSQAQYAIADGSGASHPFVRQPGSLNHVQRSFDPYAVQGGPVLMRSDIQGCHQGRWHAKSLRMPKLPAMPPGARVGSKCTVRNTAGRCTLVCMHIECDTQVVEARCLRSPTGVSNAGRSPGDGRSAGLLTRNLPCGSPASHTLLSVLFATERSERDRAP